MGRIGLKTDQLALSTLFALAVAGLFTWAGAIRPLISFSVLLFAGPITELLLAWIRSRKEARRARKNRPPWLHWVFFGQLVFIALVAMAASHLSHVSYREAFAWVWLIVAATGAINAIAAEWEDGAPGGFYNPRA